MADTESIHHGLQALLSFKDTQRALVGTIANERLTVQALHALQASDLGEASPIATVLAQVRKQQKGLLVLDAEQEGLFNGLAPESRTELKSAICVPIVGAGEKLLGLLYADSRARAGNFSYADLNKLQDVAQELAPRVAALLVEQASPTQKPATEGVTTNQLMVIGSLFLASIMIFTVGAVASRKKETPPPPPSRISIEKAGPLVVVSSFLAMMPQHDYVGLRELLSKRVREQWHDQLLSHQLDNWQSSAERREDLRYRHVRAGTGIVNGLKAEVTVDTWQRETSTYDREHNVYIHTPILDTWTVWLRKEDERWVIDRMQANGPTPVPLPPPGGAASPGP